MYVRTVTRKAKKGDVTYLQIAHNQWDPVRKRSVPTIVASIGRADKDGIEQLTRLAEACARFLGTDTTTQDGLMEPSTSRPAGGVWVLDHIWRRLGLDQAVGSTRKPGPGRPRDLRATERILFALVANRALAPSSKLAASEWMTHDVAIPGMVDHVDEDACYRAMDWLNEMGEKFARVAYDKVTDLLNLEVDLVFFDTTSTYFEIDDADEDVNRDEHGNPCEVGEATSRVGFRTWGKSKDSRDDLPQIVVGMAVTRDGIPVRCWCWPGNTSDQALIRQARDDMRAWSLSRVVWVGDRGFSSTANRRELMRGGDGYILGERLRSGSVEAKAALSRPGRYQTVAGNLMVKEVRVGSQDRFIVCLNPDQVERDQATRERLVVRLQDMIEGSDTWTPTKRAELKGRISTMPGLNRFLRVTSTGLLRVDKAVIDREADLDGKYLLRTSDPTMSAADIAQGYKQLLEVERGWRDMKSTLELRPVFHRLEDRIRAHVTLCWLALLLIRVIETTTSMTWVRIRRETQRLHQVTYNTPDGGIHIHTKPTPSQTQIFKALQITDPQHITATPV